MFMSSVLKYNMTHNIPYFGHTSSRREPAVLDENLLSYKNSEGMSENNIGYNFFSIYKILHVWKKGMHEQALSKNHKQQQYFYNNNNNNNNNAE